MKIVNCDYCGNQAKLVTGKVIYPHRPDLFKKQFYFCDECDAFVGCHEGTPNPLGRLANAELRKAKMSAHAAFDPLWKRYGKKRGSCYVWLAEQLDIPISSCHIGMFDVDTCKKVAIICNRYILDTYGTGTH